MSAIDRASGKGRLLGSVETNFIADDVQEVRFQRLIGMAREGYDGYGVAMAIIAAGKRLELGVA